jgi:Ras GTPase-activating protein 1
MDPGGDACANAEFLLLILDEITESILMSAEACPKFVIKFIANCLADTATSFFFCQFRTIRYICKCLQKKVRSRWPQERLVRTRVVSGFIFLRLLCPAILNPRNFNLIAETPSHNASRSLIMVAKCLQNLANLVEFGGKEPYMEVVNPFILKNKERMVYYLDLLSVGLLIQT